MLKFKDVPQEQTSEVVRLAAEMQHREEARGMEKSATVAAAEEVGISEEYLEKAAQELQIRRIAQAQAKRRRNTAAGWIAGGIAAVAGIGFLVRPPTPITLSTATAITRTNPGTVASVLSTGDSVTLKVDGFQQAENGEFFANAEIPMTSLAGYKNVSFNVQGQGLQNIRVDIEGGEFRWKSKPFQISSERQPVTLSFRDFQRQQRSGNGWKNVKWRSPKDVTGLSFKVGDTVNQPNVSGSATISGIVIK